MYDKFDLRAPFFEIGPKVFLYGDQTIELAIFADELVGKYEVDIVFTVQFTDIAPVARVTKHLKVFAQHMDFMEPGRGLGGVLPESIKAAGAVGVMLNHAERPLTLGALNKTIKRADSVGLATIVCADTIEESEAVAHLKPNVVLAEAPELIGGGSRTDDDAAAISETNERIRAINPDVIVMHSAGITNEQDVYDVIRNGADGTGSTSGILKAPDPLEMTEKMIRAVREAWNERNR